MIPKRQKVTLSDLDLQQHLRDPSKKQLYVTRLFDLIAPGYDSFTRVFSFGMDRRWKELLIREAIVRARDHRIALDLACGTGDIALALATEVPRLNVLGLDVSREMLQVAKARRPDDQASRVALVMGDIVSLPVASNSVDMVTMGYALRNVRDLRSGLRELRRVLKPRGWILNLDFYLPENRLWRRLFLGYMRYAGLAAGWLMHREPEAYGYITPSIEHYVTSRGFEQELRTHGFGELRTYSFLGGGVCIHVAQKVDLGAASSAA